MPRQFGELISSLDDVFVTGFPGLKGKWHVSTEGGREPMWAPDGKTIYYRDGALFAMVHWLCFVYKAVTTLTNYF
jgi:hypothetical protein